LKYIHSLPDNIPVEVQAAVFHRIVDMQLLEVRQELSKQGQVPVVVAGLEVYYATYDGVLVRASRHRGQEL